jgi:hypothetical protein
MNNNSEIDHSAKKKDTWTTPRVTELDIRSTETNSGAGADGGSFGNTANS